MVSIVLYFLGETDKVVDIEGLSVNLGHIQDDDTAEDLQVHFRDLVC